MKKKVLFSLGAIAIAAVLTMNVTFVGTSKQNVTTALASIGKISQADAECDFSGRCKSCGGECRLGTYIWDGYHE